MTDDIMDRERLISELGDIRQKLRILANSAENAGNSTEQLAALDNRIEQMIGELKVGGTFPDGGPESKTILVVDDNDELRNFVKKGLELTGYNVMDAPDRDATMMLLQNTAALDLILCDVMLPGVKGPDLIHQIRDMFPNVKTIFMSGYVAEDIVNQDVERILAAGGIFLQKPFPTRKLLEAVHDLLGV